MQMAFTHLPLECAHSLTCCPLMLTAEKNQSVNFDEIHNAYKPCLRKFLRSIIQEYKQRL